jgi:CheY-like chemotaxis protein
MRASILVVDDEPDVADLFRQRFRREARQATYVGAIRPFSAANNVTLTRR